MRRSAQVAAPLLASAALALLGCRRPEMQRCVDESNKVVDDSFCKDLPGDQQRPAMSHFHYYYGGSGSRTIGSAVTGGSYTPLSGHSYSTGTSRGGFGSSFSEGGHGSGGHGGGGE